jgi:DNA-binding MarR family transcriptional regulator
MPDLKSLKTLLFGLVRHARADLERKFTLAKIKITPFQYAVLHMIKREQKTLNQIASNLGVKPPSLVPVLDLLEKQSLIKRIRSKTDRRKVDLRITSKGISLIKKIFADHPQDSLNKAFRKLNDQKRRQLLALLSELNNNFPNL